jgi:AraC family transcriptional regulator
MRAYLCLGRSQPTTECTSYRESPVVTERITIYDRSAARSVVPRDICSECMGLSFTTAPLTSHSAVSERLGNYRGGFFPKRLRQITNFINDHLSSELSLAEMANLVSMGPLSLCSSLQRICRTDTSSVLRRPIERSLQMLKKTTTKLADIAYDLGFSSQEHFTNVFNKIVGVSPSSYRE